MTEATRPPTITSTANPRVKAWLKLRDRSERDRTGRTLVDGAREIERALAAGAAIEAVIAATSLVDADPAILRAIRGAEIDVVEAADPVVARLSFGDRADGLVAVVVVPSLRLDGIALPDDPLVVVLERIEKPGNLGAVLRSADGAGADAVIAADPRTDLFNPNAVRASLGTIFATRLAAAPPAEVIAWCRQRGLRIVTARVDGEAFYTDVGLTGPLALVLGAETTGLSDAWIGPDITTVRLPMLGVADSLNVSVAAAVLLYEARRQRGARVDR